MSENFVSDFYKVLRADPGGTDTRHIDPWTQRQPRHDAAWQIGRGLVGGQRAEWLSLGDVRGEA